jgi:hypothetical protein
VINVRDDGKVADVLHRKGHLQGALTSVGNHQF